MVRQSNQGREDCDVVNDSSAVACADDDQYDDDCYDDDGEYDEEDNDGGELLVLTTICRGR